MNSRIIREFEDKVKEVMGIDVELQYSNVQNSAIFYQVFYLYEEGKKSEQEINTTFNTKYKYKPTLLSFELLQHPNCGMEIIQKISSPDPIKEVTKDQLIELFKFTLRTIYPIFTNKHSFFSFQQPTYFKMMEEWGFENLTEYRNHNHPTEANRAIWLLDISKYTTLEVKKSEEKVNLKTRRATEKATKAEIVKKIVVKRRSRISDKEKESKAAEIELIEGLQKYEKEIDNDYL